MLLEKHPLPLLTFSYTQAPDLAVQMVRPTTPPPTSRVTYQATTLRKVDWEFWAINQVPVQRDLHRAALAPESGTSTLHRNVAVI